MIHTDGKPTIASRRGIAPATLSEREKRELRGRFFGRMVRARAKIDNYPVRKD